MDFSVCSQCGLGIEGKGLHYRDKVFCSEECCDEFDEVLAKRGVIDIEDLDEDLDEELGDDLEDGDLGYQDDDDEVSDDLLDDDYEIRPDDF